MKNTIRFSILLVFVSLFIAAVPRAEAQESRTATPVPTGNVTLTHVDVPKVDWQDVSEYKKDMKAGHEADVDQFVDANRYVIVATLTLNGDAVITGGERVRYTNHSTDSLNEIVFRLYPNTPALNGQMDVANVTLDGKAVQPSLTANNSVLSIALPQPLAPNQAAEITMDFDVVMKNGLNVTYGRFGYLENVVSGTAWYPTLSVYEKGTGWWKSMPDPDGDPAYTESGLYDVTFTSPKDVTTVMSGKVIDQKTNGDGSVTYHSVTGPMRDQAFMASPRYAITPIDVDGTRLNIVHYTEDMNGTNSVVKYATQAFDTYSKTFGDYPFAEFNIVENPTPTGVEFPGVIQIAESAWSADVNFLETLISHETGHQWFYSLVGNNQVEHPWLDESLTSYLEIVYERATYQNDAATENYISHFQIEYNGYLALGGKDLPLDLPIASYSSEGYGAIVYGKGPLFYVALDQELGLETAYKALALYFKRNEYKVVTSADVEKAFEDASGKDLSAMFAQWVTGTESKGPANTPTPLPIASLVQH